MTDREQPEALRLADWLETDIPPNDTTTFADVAAELRRLHKANQALRDRLAQPEPEPVAWHEPGAYGNVTTHKDWALANGWEPLYAAPPKHDWVGLTDEEFLELAQTAERGNYLTALRRMEAKLKEKNNGRYKTNERTPASSTQAPGIVFRCCQQNTRQLYEP